MQHEVQRSKFGQLLFSKNEDHGLAKTFEEVFRYFCAHNSPYAVDYLTNIKTILGLGFTSVLVEGLVVSTYQRKLEVFLRYCDFKKHENNITELSTKTAEMIELAFSAFRSIGYPPYYKNFTNTLNNTLGRIGVYLPERNSECHKFSQLLQQSLAYGKNT